MAGGDWDLKTHPFKERDSFRAFEDRILRGKAWRDTGYYKRVATQIAAGFTLWGCKSVDELDQRCLDLERLCEDIRMNGYKTRREIFGNGRDSETYEDEINVHIGRHGDYIFADGQHRLSISLLLKLDKIPVKVARRHAEWVRFRKEILSIAKKQNGKTYQPIVHPDLADIPFQHGGERMELIVPYVPKQGGTLLDIGAYWGYFCHRFAEIGYQCTAVEQDHINARILKKLARAENREFEVLERPLWEVTNRSFDVVLALNVFHHCLKHKWAFDKWSQWLRGLKTKALFFEPHNPSEKQMQGVFQNFGPDEFVELVSKSTGLRSIKCIGMTTNDTRKLYLLTA